MARKRAVKNRLDMRKGGRVGKQYGGYSGMEGDFYGENGGFDTAIEEQIKKSVPAPNNPLANIPVDNQYSQEEANQVAALINSGQMTVQQVADNFGLDTGTVQSALDQINAGQAAATATPAVTTPAVTTPPVTPPAATTTPAVTAANAAAAAAGAGGYTLIDDSGLTTPAATTPAVTIPAATTTPAFDPSDTTDAGVILEGGEGTTEGGTPGGQTVTIDDKGDQVISGETVTDGEAGTVTITCWNDAGGSTQVTGIEPVCPVDFPLTSPPGDDELTVEPRTITCYNAAGESTTVTGPGLNPVCPTDFPLSSPPAGTTPDWETAMHTWIAANPNATDAEGAAWLRDNLPEGVTLADAAAALNIPLDVAQKRFSIATKGRAKTLQEVSDAQLADVNLAKKTWLVDDPKTPNIDETEAAGAILKDYKRVDPSLLFEDRKAAGTDIEAGITTDAQIQALDAYTDITAPTGVDKNDFDAVIGLVTKAVKAGRIKFADYEAVVTDILNTPQFAKNMNRPPIGKDEIRQLTEKTKAAQFSLAQLTAGLGQRSEFVIDDRAFVPGVTGIGGNLSPTPEAEEKTRDQLTTTAADSVEAKITDTTGYEARQRGGVTGEAAIAGAVTALSEVGDLPPDRAAAIVEDPASVIEKMDQEAPEVIAAFKSLDPDFLVSAQIESLLGGMESGNVPSWAKPAYDAVNQKLAQRGLEVSTVGRDALFNAIIQNAIPIAQSNAQALQARATQNLSNEQQANMQRAQTDANRRLANLGNQQTAASQTAQMSQNLKLAQSQFRQEAVMLSEQQQQQIRVQNLQNRQRSADLTAQNAAANAAQNLGNRQQIEMAELEIKNQTEQQNMTAQNQERLAEFQVASEFIAKNGDFAQQMKLANLSNDQQTRLANLSSRNQADADSLTARQQTELANLNSRMQLNIAGANLANQMGVAQLNVDQQKGLHNATMVANIDLAKFSDAQQIELSNSKFMQTSVLTDFNARQQSIMQDATALASLDMAAVDQRTKLRITQAQNFLQRDMANLSNEQQALILDTQMDQQRLLTDISSQNAARQFNAASENQIEQFNESLYAQMEQFNVTQTNAMEQFNKAEENRVEAINAGNAIDAEKFNNQLSTQIKQFNEQYDLQRDQWNAANAQAIEQSNIQWRRQANTIDTAAVNASNQENAAKAFQISAADQNFMWQELRDEAAYLRQAFENEEQRKTTLYATAISNDVGDTGALGIQPIVDIVDDITGK